MKIHGRTIAIEEKSYTFAALFIKRIFNQQETAYVLDT